MKKASIHMDWVISMGIFLLYILFLFLFLKPISLTSTDGSRILPDIINQGIQDDLTTEVFELPIFVECELGTCFPGLQEIGPIIFPFQLDNINAYVINDLGNSIDFDISSCPNCLITFSDDFQQGFNTFTLIHSKNYVGSGGSSCSSCSSSMGTLTYGIPKKTKLISQVRINDLITDLNSGSITYSQLKNNWNYPSTGSFKITINQLDGTEINSFGLEPPKLDNIFVRQYVTQMFKMDGTMETVLVNVQSW